MASIELNRATIDGLLEDADDLARAEGESLESDLSDWRDRIDTLLDPSTPLTYLPVLCVTLVARAASPDVSVLRIQPKADYSAGQIGIRLVEYARQHEIDMRTDTSNLMNSQPFVRQPEITADLSPKPEYGGFFAAVQAVEELTSDEALRVLALAFHLGRANWPHRKRRQQRNMIHPAPAQAEVGEGYFILNQSPHQDFEHYDGDDYYGFHENVTSAKALVEAGAGTFVFYRTSDATDSPMTFVGSGSIARVDQRPDDDQGRQTFHARIANYQPFDRPVPKAEGAPKRWNSQNSISRITKEAFDRLVLLGTGEPPPVEPMSLPDLRAACDERGLMVADRVLVTLLAALDSGKHVVLTGPPGTAKTTLAVLVADLAARRGHSEGHLLTTATSDWSTYDTIGGLAPRSDGTLRFRRGRFLDALAGNQWLIVDELNRANFDRAFGQLFTVLSGQDVVLPFEDPQSIKPLRLRQATTEPAEDYEDVVLNPQWRMIATINNFDKSLLFELSFALMRRFAFVEVPAPDDEAYLDLVKAIVIDEAEDVAHLVETVVEGLLPIRSIRQIGPAAYLDLARMATVMARGSELTAREVALQGFYAMLLPQFEGIEEGEGRRLFNSVREAVGADLSDELRRVLREVLGLDLGRSTGAETDDVVAQTMGRASEELAEEDPTLDGGTDLGPGASAGGPS